MTEQEIKKNRQAFAHSCGIKTNRLSVEIDRGKVHVDEDGTIDPLHEKNVAFKSRVLAKQANKRVPTVDVDEYDDELPELPEMGDIMDLETSEKRKKHFDAINAERNSELLKLKTEKLQGIVVPSEPIIPLFLQHNQHILMAQKNADEEILTAFAHKYSIPPADVAYMRGEWVKARNSAIKKATDASVKGINSIINDYSDRRGVGERA